MWIRACSATFLSVARLRGIVGIVQSHPFASDAVLAGVLAVLALGDIYSSGDYLTGSRWIYVPAALLMTVPLAWRRIAPLPVIAVVMGALIAQSLALGTAPSPDFELVAWLIAVYSVAAHSERRTALVGGGIGLAGGVTWIGLDDFLLPVVTFGGAWLADGSSANVSAMPRHSRTERVSWSASATPTPVSPQPRSGCVSPGSSTTSSVIASA